VQGLDKEKLLLVPVQQGQRWNLGLGVEWHQKLLILVLDQSSYQQLVVRLVGW
jgi:hypothetical protein